ncbi:MAG: ATP-binding protein [Bacilli bacterium]|jgi:predicted AAA+ superfamily ATPase|nr:ATP-binding protein [Clostridium sp.]MDY3797973.1 ATP-binding protein [Bacilli bacterium]
MIKREMYLKKIRDSYDSELIKIIVGVRRSGKSVLMMQIIDELKEKGINEDHIIYINFEDYDYTDYTKPKEFNKYIKDKIKDNDKYYLLFDEIQNVEDFEKVINSFRVTMNVSIFITGSNSKVLSGDLSTHLAGRYINIKMMPFTFSEYLELQNSQGIIKDKDEAFLEYVEWGGMPQIYNSTSIQERKMYLRDLYNTVILKDIVERNNIKDVNLLNRVIQFMMENIGGVISANSITKFLKNDNVITSVDTVLNYIEYINNSMIASKTSRYNIRGKSVMTLLEKYYVVDLGLLQLKSSPIEKKVGGRLENIVYNELIARGYDVYIGKTDNGEIDFVVDDFGDRFYIQVADYLSSDEVVEREFGAYKNVADNFPKYVITMDKINYSRDGIIHKNIIDWLLEK